MWSELCQPALTLIDGKPRDLRGFGQELTHAMVHSSDGFVLWCDGEHGFNPYDMAELNLTRGYQADHGADRVLIKRCMTAFQWDTVLTRHLEEKLEETQADLVIISPYDRLLVHQELQDWEQEDHTRFSLKHLKHLVEEYEVPIILTADMGRWWHTHPELARLTYESVDARWTLTRPDDRWRVVSDRGDVLDPLLRQQVTLWDYATPVTVPQPRSKRSASMTLTHAATKSATNWASSQA